VKKVKIALIPFALLYGLVVFFRNLLFDLGIFSSKRFEFPVISVGNLSTGGTGKTPHIEYLVRLLKDNYKIAVLSRGYGRKTSGFVLSDENSNALKIGDEPLQIKNKFKDIMLAVSGNRVKGIKKIKLLEPETKIVLLDDAFQHRWISPAINILLTDYSNLYTDDFLLPAGNLREGRSRASRADIIIVTKTPVIFSPLDRRFLTNKLNPKPYQKIFFSYTKYGDIEFLNPEGSLPKEKEFYFNNDYSALLVTGIANSQNFKYFMENKLNVTRHIEFSDHHFFSIKDISDIKHYFNNIASDKKIIITTEKDAMRMMEPSIYESLKGITVAYIPIEIAFHGNDEENFNYQILDHVKQNN
jgi:tetraacyldisaccharide 4'-kinase